MAANVTADEVIQSEMLKRELKIISGNLANAAKAFNAAQLKCDRLREFRQEYVNRINNEMQDLITDETREGFRTFFAKLDVEILKQQEIVDDLRSQLKIQRQLWQECQRKKISGELQAVNRQETALMA